MKELLKKGLEQQFKGQLQNILLKRDLAAAFKPKKEAKGLSIEA